MGFPRQEYWSGLPFLPPGDLPNSGIKPESPALAGGFVTTESPGKPFKGVVWLHSIPGLGRSPEEEMAIHSSILAREIPWAEEPGGQQSLGLQKSQTRLSD